MGARTAAILLFGLTAAASGTAPETDRAAALSARLPAYAAAAETEIRIPADVMVLGEGNPMYRCWKLRLAGAHGRKVRELLLRMESARETLGALLAQARRDAALRAAGERGPELDARVERTAREAEALYERLASLERVGSREGLIRIAEPGMFRKRRSVGPALRQEDYSMVYDDALPGCPPRADGAADGGT